MSLIHLQDAFVRNIEAGEGATSHAKDVRVLEAALLAEGLLSSHFARDGFFGARTKNAYAQWQRRTEVPRENCTGRPDGLSLTKLGNRHGFAVRD